MRVCVIELNHFHTEVFPVYAALLPDLLGEAVDIDYFVNPAKFPELRPIYGDRVHTAYRQWPYRVAAKTGLRAFYFRHCVNAIVKQHRPDVLVFNSAEPARVYSAFKHARAATKLGIVHVYGQVPLIKSPGERYFVLGPNVYEHHRPQGIVDGYFLPFFSPHPIAPTVQRTGTTIGIQGNIDYRRRNYPGLLDLAAELQQRGVHNVRFNIIGSARHRDAKRLRRAIQARSVEKMFVLHDKLNDADFFQQVLSCNYLMPLLGAEHSRYYRFMITSTLSHASAYGIPLILDRDNSAAWGIPGSEAIVFSSLADLAEQIVRGDLTQRREALGSAFASGVKQRIEENRRALREVMRIS